MGITDYSYTFFQEINDHKLEKLATLVERDPKAPFFNSYCTKV